MGRKIPASLSGLKADMAVEVNLLIPELFIYSPPSTMRQMEAKPEEVEDAGGIFVGQRIMLRESNQDLTLLALRFRYR